MKTRYEEVSNLLGDGKYYRKVCFVSIGKYILTNETDEYTNMFIQARDNREKITDINTFRDNLLNKMKLPHSYIQGS